MDDEYLMLCGQGVCTLLPGGQGAACGKQTEPLFSGGVGVVGRASLLLRYFRTECLEIA